MTRSLSRWWRRIPDPRPFRRRLFVPRLVVLEDRTLPSTYLVTSLADGGAGSLRQAVLDANTHPGADAIAFAPTLHGTIGLTSGQLNVTGSLTLTGPSAGAIIVSGTHASRIFDIAAGVTAAIDDLTLTQGRANQGGAVRNAGHLTLAQDVLTYNEATARAAGFVGGGALFNDAGASLLLSQSTLANNRAVTSGGGLFSKGLATLRGDTFTGNEASAGGGVDNDGVALTITDNCFFAGNVANGSMNDGAGGALVNNTTASIFNSTFTGNVARGADGDLGLGEGGALYNPIGSSLTLMNVVVTGNAAFGSDGADGINKLGQATGGGIVNYGSLLVTGGSVIIGNLARGGDVGINDPSNPFFTGAGAGGGIFNFGSASVIDSTVSGNEAVGGNSASGAGGVAQGGGIINVGPSLVVVNSTVVGNSATGGTGSTNSEGGPATGGGIENDAALVATVLTLVGNSALGGPGGTGAAGGIGFGGGLSVGFGGTALLTGGTVSGNLARGGDGGAPPDGSSAGDGGTGQGGGIGIGDGVPFGLPTDNSSVTLHGVTVASNLAEGGNSGGFLTSGNGGDGLGGGVYVANGSTAALRNTTVTANEADGGLSSQGTGGSGLGGGVYNAAGGTAFVDLLTVIAGNRASTGNNDTFGDIDPLR
jgi:hypothetical protein